MRSRPYTNTADKGTRESSRRLLDYVSGNIGEAEVAAHVAVGQPGVVQTQAVQNGCLQIVEVNGVFDDREAEVVETTLGDHTSSLDTLVGRKIHKDTEAGANNSRFPRYDWWFKEIAQKIGIRPPKPAEPTVNRAERALGQHLCFYCSNCER